MKLCSIALVTALLAASSAGASQIGVTSYDMLNGDGNAQGGTFNYWDGNYNGNGCTTCDNAPLSGGTGALTDGVIATDLWYNVSNEMGTGQYVGWQTQITGNPTITFSLAGSSHVGSVVIYVDNSNFGGVGAPSALVIDGTSYTPTVTAYSTYAEQLSVTGLNLTGGSLTLTAIAGSEPWVFISEVQFFSARNVPEPGTLALFGGALAAAGAFGRRRRARSA